MVGPPRGPPRPSMAPQPRATTVPSPSPQPQQQIILKQVMPYTMVSKPSTQNFVNYLQLPVMPGNGSFLAVSSKPPETNGTTFLTMSPRPSYLVTTANNNNNNNNNKSNTNNNSATYIAMESPSAHQYLIPKPEPFAMHNYSKNEPSPMSPPAVSKRKMPVVTRPTNHQRMKEEVEEDEGEEVRPVLDPDRPLLDQLVQIDHSYPHWLPPRLPPIDDEDKESTISSDEKPEGGDEGEETETAAEGEDSITRCICNLDHDDGYMISCDQCYVWQHVACVLPEIPIGNALPDLSYLCDLCQPRDFDRHRARALQLQRRKQILHRDDSSGDSWSSADRNAHPPKKAVARRRAEPVPRRPSKSKRDTPNGPVKNRPRLDSADGPLRTKKSDHGLENQNRTKLLKPLNRGRRDSVKSTPPTPQHHTPTSVGRRTKLKRKFENKPGFRRRTKSKDALEIKQEKEDEKPKVMEQRSSRSAAEKAQAKSRCRLSHTAIGEPILVATCRVTAAEPITELRGKYLQSSSTSPRAEVLYHYRFPKDGTEVIMDGSGRENLVRYARRTCYPNSQLKHCLVKGSLRLYLVAMETLERNQQITIPHGCVTESITAGEKETCGKNCVYGQKMTSDIVERRRRARRRTLSEESEDRSVSPVKRGEMGRPPSPLSPTSDKERKLTREEKKIEQAMKIFAQMEKDTARKRDKERPERTLSGNFRRGGDSDKESPVEGKARRRRRRRRRRSSRKSSLPSGSGAGMSHPSGDESDVSSGDDDKDYSKDSSKEEDDDKDTAMTDAAGLLLALGGARNNADMGRQTPPHTREQSENDSSPGTPLSSACLLVAAAVGPLAPGFKFPKTKKGMMNEWLGRSPEHVAGDASPVADRTAADVLMPQGAPKLTNLSNRLYFPSREPNTGSAEFGKKRWLRQAISEEIETPLGSPPCPPDNGTPLKKRRLARESVSLEPSSTPTNEVAPSMPDDELAGDDNPSNDLVERVRGLQRNYMAAQGIEYDTSPQRVPENLSVAREEENASPLMRNTRARRGRKRPAAKAQTRPSPRAKRKRALNHGDEDNVENSPVAEEELTSPVLTSIKDEVVDRLEDSSEPPPVLTLAEGATDMKPIDYACKVVMSEVKAETMEENKGVIVKVEQLESTEVIQKAVTQCEGSEKDVVDVKESQMIAVITKVEEQVVKKEEETSAEKKDPFGEELLSVSNVEEEPSKEPTPVEVNFAVRDEVDSTLDDAANHSSAGTTPEDAEADSVVEKTKLTDPRRPVDVDEGDKSAPAKRKLSITEYLKRKGTTGKKSAVGLPRIEESKSRPPSPPSDDEISPLLIPTPTLPFPLLDGPTKGGRFKVEPTELERQRENLNERLRREFGLLINDDEPKPPPTTPETNGFPESKLAYPVAQHLPQSAIYPVGSSNPPNPFTSSYSPEERFNFRK